MTTRLPRSRATPTRRARPAGRERRSVAAATAPLLAAVLLVGGCGGGGSRPRAGPTTRTDAATVRLSPGPVQVEATGAPGALADPDRDRVLTTLAAYVRDATLRPLAGRRAGLETISPELVGRLDAAQRDALVDDGLPTATARPSVRAAPVPLTVLLDPAGRPALVGASLDITIRAPVQGRAPLVVHRRGEVVLGPVGGQWRITSFQLAVSRDLPGNGPGRTGGSVR